MFGTTSPFKPQQSFFGDRTPGHSDIATSPFEDYGLDFYDGLVAPFPSRAPSPIAFDTFDPSKVYEDIFGFQGFPEEEFSQRAQERHQQQQLIGKSPAPVATPDWLEKLRDLANIKTELPDIASPESSSEISLRADASHLASQLLELPSLSTDAQSLAAKRVRKPSQKVLENIGRSSSSSSPATTSALSHLLLLQPTSSGPSPPQRPLPCFPFFRSPRTPPQRNPRANS